MFPIIPKSFDLARTITACILAAFLISLTVQPLRAAEDIYLPLAASPVPESTGPGSDQVRGAGVFGLDDGSQQPEIGAEPDPTGEEKQLDETLGDGSKIECTVTPMKASDILATQDMRVMDNDPAVFPGALIQGQSLQNGQLTQIKGIPRADGVIYLTNLTFDGESEGGKLYTRDVAPVSAAEVNEQIQDMVTNEPRGTGALVDFYTEYGYSWDYLMFSIGLDVDFPSGYFQSELDFQETNSRSYAYMMFTQIYYDVVFDSWTGPASLFRDGEAFQDVNDEIGPGNPPLYVEKVSYGRQILFVAESEYSASELKAAMQGAYGNVSGDAEAEYKKVMQRTKVTWKVRGGDAGAALDALADANDVDRWQALRDAIADERTATYSPSSPGVPIFYTLRYLGNNDYATLQRAVNYGEKNCSLAPPAPADRPMWLKLRNIYYSVRVSLDGKEVYYLNGVTQKSDSGYIGLNKWIKGDVEHVFTIELYEHPFLPGTDTSLTIDVYKDDQSKADYSLPHSCVDNSIWDECDDVTWRFSANARTGLWELRQ